MKETIMNMSQQKHQYSTNTKTLFCETAIMGRAAGLGMYKLCKKLMMTIMMMTTTTRLTHWTHS